MDHLPRGKRKKEIDYWSGPRLELSTYVCYSAEDFFFPKFDNEQMGEVAIQVLLRALIIAKANVPLPEAPFLAAIDKFRKTPRFDPNSLIRLDFPISEIEDSANMVESGKIETPLTYSRLQ